MFLFLRRAAWRTWDALVFVHFSLWWGLHLNVEMTFHSVHPWSSSCCLGLYHQRIGHSKFVGKRWLVVGNWQVTGKYQAKDPQMALYLRYVTLLRETFPTFELVHVPREQNAQADLLAKLASSGKGGRKRLVIQETLKSPRTTTNGVVEVSHIETLEVSLVKGRRHRSLTQETLKVPKINAYCLSGEDSLEVLQVDIVET